MTNRSRLPVFMASLMTETNSFAPFPTGLAAFEECGIVRRNGAAEGDDTGDLLRIFRSLAEADGRPVIESLSACALPAGPTVQSVYESLRDIILDDLRGAGPVGFVILALHGGMIASECDDCEGDLLARAREIVGPGVPIGVELDPHCHLTSKMVDYSDVIVIMKEYPHTDWDDRARELYAILSAQVEGRSNPVSAKFDCRMVGAFPTTIPPMNDLVQMLKDAERTPGILSASLAHGFPWGDQAESGARMLVIAAGNKKLASTTAERLGRAFYAMRDELLLKLPTIAQALDRASTLDGLIVMADTGDNPGGGAPGDTTHLLRALVDCELGPAVFGAIYDPGAVRICQEAGVGARILLRIGGKLGASSGDAYDVQAEVIAVVRDHSQSMFGGQASLGASAWIRVGQVDVILASVRTQIYSRDAFTGLGIVLADKRVVAVKSSEHYRADFAKIADHVLAVATPGALQLDFASIEYRQKQDLAYHPRVSDPLGSAFCTAASSDRAV